MYGGQLECGVNGVLSYQGGSNYVWLRQYMGFDDVVKAVEGTIQKGLQGRRLCHSMIGRCYCHYKGMGMWEN